MVKIRLDSVELHDWGWMLDFLSEHAGDLIIEQCIVCKACSAVSYIKNTQAKFRPTVPEYICITKMRIRDTLPKIL